MHSICINVWAATLFLGRKLTAFEISLFAIYKDTAVFMLELLSWNLMFLRAGPAAAQTDGRPARLELG